jgi:hypothetical protein
MLMPMLAFAQQSGISGTWKIDLNKVQMDSKARVYELKDGMFSCSTCDPKVSMMADGKEHKVAGSPYFDMASVTVVDPSTVEMTGTKDGKLAFRITSTVSPDGKTLTRKYEGHPAGSSEVSTDTSILSRVGEPEMGAHAVSGSWKVEKFESASENWLTFTYASTGDGLKYKASTGENYDAKFDGKDHPYQGDPGTTSVVLKKIDDNTFEETDKRDGEVIGVSRMTLSPDSKALTIVTEDKRRGVTDTWVAERQENQEAEK